MHLLQNASLVGPSDVLVFYKKTCQIGPFFSLRLYFSGPKGARKNNFTFLAPMHPAWLRCESSEYAWYSCAFAPCQAGASTLRICEFISARTLSALIHNYGDVLSVIFFHLKTLGVEWIRFLIYFFSDRIYRINGMFFACGNQEALRPKALLSRRSCKSCLII